jgi:hypothetical protein
LRQIKIGEPNKNCDGIPLNPTYWVRKGSGTDSLLGNLGTFLMGANDREIGMAFTLVSVISKNALGKNKTGGVT